MPFPRQENHLYVLVVPFYTTVLDSATFTMSSVMLSPQRSLTRSFASVFKSVEPRLPLETTFNLKLIVSTLASSVDQRDSVCRTSCWPADKERAFSSGCCRKNFNETGSNDSSSCCPSLSLLSQFWRRCFWATMFSCFLSILFSCFWSLFLLSSMILVACFMVYPFFSPGLTSSIC